MEGRAIANNQDFQLHIRKLVEINPSVSLDVEITFEWLTEIAPEHWSRSFFPLRAKCDILVINLCECFNNYILDAMIN